MRSVGSPGSKKKAKTLTITDVVRGEPTTTYGRGKGGEGQPVAATASLRAFFVRTIPEHGHVDESPCRPLPCQKVEGDRANGPSKETVNLRARARESVQYRSSVQARLFREPRAGRTDHGVVERSLGVQPRRSDRTELNGTVLKMRGTDVSAGRAEERDSTATYLHDVVVRAGEAVDLIRLADVGNVFDWGAG